MNSRKSYRRVAVSAKVIYAGMVMTKDKWDKLSWLASLNAGLISVAECEKRLAVQEYLTDIITYVVKNKAGKYILCQA